MNRTRVIPIALCLLLTGVVAGAQTLPTITLTPGEFYFRVNGVPSVVLGTNPTGWMTTQFDTLLGFASANEKIVRIHITNGKRPSPLTAPGQVDATWAAFWDGVFTTAEQNGLYVLPVFDVWADWSETNPGAQSWASNAYNTVNGGPAMHPAELLGAGCVRHTACTQDLWLDWIEALVIRWAGRPNILGWELFSELNLITGATEADAVLFVENVAAVIRAADTGGRPVTASLAGINDWPTLSRSSVDFIQIHPYAGFAPWNGNLDELILDTVRDRRTLYNKPIFIGESGLDTLLPNDPANSLTLDPDASTGINQAIWAAAVSGGLNGRMLWFEDGYDQYHDDASGNPLNLTLSTAYQNASAPVSAFLQGVDYSNFVAVNLAVTSDIMGATLGNDHLILGWVKDVQSVAPDWPTRLLTAQTATVSATGVSHDWLVTFYDTSTGTVLQSDYVNQAADDTIVVAIPDFQGSIAFRVEAVPAIHVTIDIIPGGTRNRINPNLSSLVTVAVLTTSDFDARDVAVSTVEFGPAGASPRRARPRDVNRDGNRDLKLRFRQNETGFVCGDVLGVLTGETLDGRAIEGSDSVTIVPCP